MKKILYTLFSLFLLFGIIACNERLTTTYELPAVDSVGNFKNYEQLEAYLSQFFTKEDQGYVLKNGRFFFSEASIAGAMMEDSATVTSSSNAYSQTNVQVEGVDEADIVITDGRYIYIVAMNRFVLIDAFSLEILYSFHQENLYLNNMYFTGTRVVLMGNEYTYDETVTKDFYYRYRYNYGVKIIVLDISDVTDVEITKEVYFDQSYLADSRMIEGNLYLVMNNYYINYGFSENNFVPTYVDSSVGSSAIRVSPENIYYMPNDNYSLSYLLIASFNVFEDKEVNVDAYLGSTYQLYMSLNNLYTVVYRYTYNVTTEMYENYTYIMRFEIQAGRLVYEAMGTVFGSPLNQFSMDEYDGTFRIATTDYIWTPTMSAVTNQLYILNAETEDKMEEISVLRGLGKPGERIYAVRFSGTTAYVVTFVNTDPLYKLDLSDPTNPSITGELYEEGVSDYLHQVNDDLMIGVGRSSETVGGFTRFTGVKISLYDTSGNTPVTLDTYFAEGEYSYTPVTYDHKMFVYYQPEGADYWLLAIPVFEYGNDGSLNGFYYQQNLYVFKITFAGDLQYLTKIPVNFNSGNYDYYYYDYLLRGLFIGDYVYSISYHQIKMYDISNDFAFVNAVNFAPVE
jgi:uncharacterized secreted protein with C-terminal beta-propeller domain